MFETFQLKSGVTGLMGYHWESENAKAVLCIIHGMGEYGGKYERMADEMVRNNIAVLAMDLRGHGCSVGKRGHIGRRADVLRDVDGIVSLAMRKYIDLPIVVYGHSLGGNIVLDYRHHGSLATTPALYVASSPWLVLNRKLSRVRSGVIRVMGRLKPDFPIRAHVNRLNDDRLAHDNISALTIKEGTTAAKNLLSGDPYWNVNGRKPLIIMQGTADRVCNPEGPRKIAEIEGSGCKLVEWRGFGHELHGVDGLTDGTKVIKRLAELIEEELGGGLR
ncbi:lysophospholipase [Clostridia bacterium]|nr:lysophospholipase [Clostridia bacterium]